MLSTINFYTIDRNIRPTDESIKAIFLNLTLSEALFVSKLTYLIDLVMLIIDIYQDIIILIYRTFRLLLVVNENENKNQYSYSFLEKFIACRPSFTTDLIFVIKKLGDFSNVRVCLYKLRDFSEAPS